jgi:uncharacterized membrane protein YobD (UPF0266 family)
MKLSRNYLIAALVLVILYILYTRPMKSTYDIKRGGFFAPQKTYDYGKKKDGFFDSGMMNVKTKLF